MIKPTPGRVVWYHPDSQDRIGSNDAPMVTLGDLPLAAHIVGIHDNRCVNLAVFDAVGRQHTRERVQLLQGDGEDDQIIPGMHAYAEWMPYQKARAQTAPVTKLEQVEKMGLREKVDFISRVCHEVNRAYCMALGDSSQPAWEDAPQWQKESAYLGVQMHLNNPDAGPEASHQSWMNQKITEGWIYGPIKDPILKQHPCMVPFAQLSVEQQAKDFIFRGVVHALS